MVISLLQGRRWCFRRHLEELDLGIKISSQYKNFCSTEPLNLPVYRSLFPRLSLFIDLYDSSHQHQQNKNLVWSIHKWIPNQCDTMIFFSLSRKALNLIDRMANQARGPSDLHKLFKPSNPGPATVIQPSSSSPSPNLQPYANLLDGDSLKKIGSSKLKWILEKKRTSN